MPRKTYITLLRLLAGASCTLCAVAPAMAQKAKESPTPAAAEKSTPSGTATASAAEMDESIMLSPFTVQTSKNDIGYFASNTLAGSRLNSNVSDLASPITVITKQQLEDTGARDLNDVFLYEANTEGALNYTPIEINRSGLKDRIGGSATNGIGANTATTANRVRGLGTADMMWNYYPSIARVRADTYNADSLEISRGPNAILAGLGSPAGILNQSIGTGRINVDSNEVNIAFGSFGAQRYSFATNKTLIKDKLAVNFSALYDDRAFSRKPSYDISRRQSGGFTFRPTKSTTLKGFIENYTNDSRTPNQLTPRDGITPWLAAGRPVWDPLTRQITRLDTGVVSGPFLTTGTQVIVVNGANVTLTGDAVFTDYRSPQYIPGIGVGALNRPTRFINADGSSFWTQTQAQVINIYGLTQAQVNADPVLFDIYNRRMTQSVLPPAPAAYDVVGAATYVPPSVSNKRIYNWEDINLNAANYGSMRNTTYNLEFEQQILPNLAFSAGWFRQDLDSLENYPIAQLATTTLLIDTSKNLPNGQANPNYLRPFIDTQDPDTAKTPETSDIKRAMLAWDLDFTKRDGWTQWLGRHRILAFGSHQERVATQIRGRFAFSDPSDPRFLQSTSALGLVAARPAGFRYGGNSSASRHVYYVGDNNSQVLYGPATTVGNLPMGTTQTSSVTAYNYTTRQWEQAPITYGTEWFDAGNGAYRSEQKINSLSFAAQSFWWKDRIVTTTGLRRDRWDGRTNTTAGLTNADLYPVGSWRLAEESLGLLNRFGANQTYDGITGSMGVVVKPLRWINFSANKSDNFNPPGAAQTDIFGRTLPKPTGKSKDYGVTFNLLENKLIAKVTFFETTNEDDRSNPNVATLLGRLQRQDTANLRGWAEMVVRVRAGQNPTLSNTWNSATLTPTQLDAVSALMGGLVENWPAGAGITNITSTQTSMAKGAEFELIYNPVPNWNIKMTAAKVETTYQNIMPEYEAWLAYRQPVWQSAAAPDMAAEYVTPGGSRISLRNFYSGYGFGETNITTGINGSNPEDWFQKVVAGELAAARQLENATPYGLRKWRANILTNYLFTRGPLKNFTVGGAIRWEDRALLGYYGVLNSAGKYTRIDTNRPVYDTDAGVSRLKDLTHLDLWLSYRFKLMHDKVHAKVQLNVVDVAESGGIVPIHVNYDGSVSSYRIVDSRRFTLSTKLEF